MAYNILDDYYAAYGYIICITLINPHEYRVMSFLSVEDAVRFANIVPRTMIIPEAQFEWFRDNILNPIIKSGKDLYTI